MAVLAPVLGVFSLRSRTSKDERDHLIFHRRTVLSVLYNLRRSWLQGFVVILLYFSSVFEDSGSKRIRIGNRIGETLSLSDFGVPDTQHLV